MLRKIKKQQCKPVAAKNPESSITSSGEQKEQPFDPHIDVMQEFLDAYEKHPKILRNEHTISIEYSFGRHTDITECYRNYFGYVHLNSFYIQDKNSMDSRIRIDRTEITLEEDAGRRAGYVQSALHIVYPRMILDVTKIIQGYFTFATPIPYGIEQLEYEWEIAVFKTEINNCVQSAIPERQDAGHRIAAALEVTVSPFVDRPTKNYAGARRALYAAFFESRNHPLNVFMQERSTHSSTPICGVFGGGMSRTTTAYDRVNRALFEEKLLPRSKFKM